MRKEAALLLALLLLPGLLTTRAASTPMPIIVNEYLNATVIADGYGYYCGPWNVSGRIVVLNNNTGETVSDIWLPIVKPSGLEISILSKPSYADVRSGDPPDYVKKDNSAANEFWHITRLESGDSVTLQYTYTGSGCPGILVEERYDPVKIVDGVESTISVKLNLTNNFGFDVEVKVKKVLPRGVDDHDGWLNVPEPLVNPYFSGTPSANLGKISYSSNGKELYWTSDGSWPDGWFTLRATGHGNSTFQITGTPDLSEVGGYTQKITLGTVYIYLKASRTFTGLTIGKVFAIANANVEVKKEQDLENPSTWKETLVFYDTSAVFKYDLFNTTVWATKGNTPDSALIDNSLKTEERFNITQLGPGQSYPYGPHSFTYDGVPKVWGLAKFRITNSKTEGWWAYYNFTSVWPPEEVKYLVHEEIWAIKGYAVKAKKEVVAESTAGCYLIGITLQNIGEWKTPYVEFYDVVPSGFNVNPDDKKQGNMILRPLSMLALDADSDTPPDYSLITSPAGYTKGYVWKVYPIPAPQYGFAQYFKGPGEDNKKQVTVRLSDGSTKTLNVYPVDSSRINVDGSEYSEGTEFTIGGTSFLVAYVDDNLTSGGGWVVVSAKGSYENLNMYIYNPIFAKYRVCGSDVYNATDLFIIGVDPRNTLDALAISAPEAAVSYGTSNFEILFAIAAVAVSVVLVRKR